MPNLIDHLAKTHPDAAALIAAGRVLVNGFVVNNPNSHLKRDAVITFVPDKRLRGAEKLRAALDAFQVEVVDKTCVDCGAAAGGFTSVLLERGAAKVYAVEVGYGQLLGSIAVDARVISLERTNLADVHITEPISVITLDLSYLSLAKAAPQLDSLPRPDNQLLVGLVKPMFELALATAPTDESSVDSANARATEALGEQGWDVRGSIRSPVTGSRGAREGFICATR